MQKAIPKPSWYKEDGKINWPGISTLIGGVILMLYLGCFFLWGNISIYVLSYFHEYNPDASFDFVFLVDSFLILSNWFGYQVGVYVFQKRRWHPKLVIGVGATISLTGVFLSSLTVSIGPYLACYCLLNGLGCGMCYMVPLICGWEWFPEKRGLVTGITLGGYGFGSFIFSQISTKLVNPNNDKADPLLVDGDIDLFGPEVADRVPFMIQTLVYIWACLAFVSILLISRKPSEAPVTMVAIDEAENIAEIRPVDGTPNTNEKVDDTLFNTATTIKTNREDVTMGEGAAQKDSIQQNSQDMSQLSLSINGDYKMQIRGVKYCFYSKRFWQYFVIMILANYFGTFFSYSYKPFGLASSPHDPISDKTLTWAASVGSGLVNGLSRIIFGTLVDKYSFRFLLSLLMMIQLFNSLVCFWAAYNPGCYFICVLLNYMVLGGLFAVFPVSVTRLFGLEFGPTIYVQILFGSFVSSLINLMSTKWLEPATNFVTLFYIGSATQIATLAMLWWFREELDVDNLAKVNGLVRVDDSKQTQQK